ncbi:MAG: hypothetical protein BGO68_04770 [Candidatus Amoebophilus sp. 36-38]|nr:MAG: hypothetical protein BGO68_04770 [Candidatus Amoebophilus sp. 36-38]
MLKEGDSGCENKAPLWLYKWSARRKLLAPHEKKSWIASLMLAMTLRSLYFPVIASPRSGRGDPKKLK